MIRNRKKFFSGVALLGGFVAVLVVLFSPVFGSMNGLNFLDSLYNSISKGSADYFLSVKEITEAFSDESVSVTLSPGAADTVAQTALMFEKSGVRVEQKSGILNITGKLGMIFKSSLEDAEKMYHNDGTSVRMKYGMDEKRVLYNWHCAFKEMEKELNRQKKFKEAKAVGAVIDRAIDLSYNYYGIEAEKISDSFWVVVFSLIFYVVYTLWFGFAVLFLFEGAGLRLDH